MADLTSDAPRPPPPQAQSRSFRTFRTIGALVMREVQTTYGRNVGGYIWAFVEPIGGIFFFSFVLAIGLKIRHPSLGTNFPLFYGTGFLALGMFLSCSRKVGTAIQYSRALLSYPGVEWTHAVIARLILNITTQFLVGVIIFFGIHAIYDVESILNIPAILGGFVLAAIAGTGIGLLNGYIFAVLPLWQSAWGILTRPLFLFSTVLYIYEDIPPRFQPVLWWNPIVHAVGMLRRGFYATYDAPYVSVLYVVILSMITALMGLILMQRYHRDILNR